VGLQYSKTKGTVRRDILLLKAVKDTRGKKLNTFNYYKLINSYKIIIKRLKKEFSKVKKELKGFKELIKLKSL
jgi:hypothetical protein